MLIHFVLYPRQALAHDDDADDDDNIKRSALEPQTIKETLSKQAQRQIKDFLVQHPGTAVYGG